MKRRVPPIRERAIAGGLLISMLGSAGFMFAYAEQSSTQFEGFTLACIFAGLCMAFLGFSRWIVPYEEVTDLRDTYPQPVEERAGQVDAFAHGAAELTRVNWLKRLAMAAFALLGFAALFPVGSLGPMPDGDLFRTRWKKGLRARREDGTLVKASEVNVNGVMTIFPEDAVGDYHSMAVLIRLPQGIGKDTTDNGLISYSKACTHAGCPVALYRAKDHRLVCPCHQSTFDVANDAAVVFGPADHPLPRLPIGVDAEGYVVAMGDFNGPIGPGFWEHA